MEKLKTATGKEFDCDYFNPNASMMQIHVRVVGESLATIATVFANPAETVQMWWEGQYAAQYTKIIAIVPETGAVRVVLGKE